MRGASLRARRDRGVIIMWFALFMMLILGFIALGIDVAKLLATRSQLQNAADSAALAGASALNPTTGIIDAAQAVARAQQTAPLNHAFIDAPEPVVVDPVDVVTTTNTCKVTVRREGANSIVTYFANVLGLPALTATATATAKVDTALSALCGVVPLAGAPLDSIPFTVGQVYVLKLPGGSGMTGNYLALDLTQCAAEVPECVGLADGAKLYQCLLAHGTCCELNVGDVLETKTGNMSGPSKKGIEYRFQNDTVQAQDITYSQYVSMGGNGSRVVLVPITNLPANGAGTVTVKEFATFFLRNIPGNGNNSEVDGEFILATIAGTGGGSGPGAVSFALRLIK